MELTKIEKNGVVCAVVNSNDMVITDAQASLDLLMTSKYETGTKNIVIDGGIVKVYKDEFEKELYKSLYSHFGLQFGG